MAGDFGQIIDPYRVAPAQGGLDDLALFMQRRQMVDQAQQQQMLAQATRAYLAQQQGLPGGVDPMAVQTYQGEGQRQDIAGQTNTRANAMEGRQAQDHQSKYDFANKFITGLPEQSDPTLRAAQQAGGPLGAQLLAELLGGQYGRQGELQNRTQMNDADNQAAQQRLETELRMRNEAAVAEENRKLGVDTKQEERIRQALIKGSQTGDYTDFYALAPNALNSPYMFDREMESKESAARIAAERKRQEEIEKAKALKPSPVGEIQGRTDVSKTRLGQLAKLTPVAMALDKGTDGKPGIQNLAENTPLGIIGRYLMAPPNSEFRMFEGDSTLANWIKNLFK